MRQRVLIDAGTIHQHFIQDPPAKIEQLFDAIERCDIEAAVPEQVLVEVYKQVCVESGKEQAALVINAIYTGGDGNLPEHDLLHIPAVLGDDDFSHDDRSPMKKPVRDEIITSKQPTIEIFRENAITSHERGQGRFRGGDAYKK